MKKELKRSDGEVFVTLEYQSKAGFVYVNWIGRQTVETVMAGGDAMYDLLQETGCPKFLNDNRELVGPWDHANDWVEKVWTPRMIGAGLQYLAFVVSHGRYGQLSAEDAAMRIGNYFSMQLFKTYEEAFTWLQQIDK